MTTTLDAAVAAAQAGLAVIYQNGKKAVSPGWNKGPANTPEQLRETYREGRNIAFRAGPTSHIAGEPVVVLDVDLRSADKADIDDARAAYRELVGETKPTVATGGGGFHLYLRMPIDSVPAAPATVLRHSTKRLPSGKPAWTIELLSAEHAVTMPPSIHPSGKAYRWLNGELEHVPVAPESLLSALGSVGSVSSPSHHSANIPEPLPDPLPAVPQFSPALLPESVRAWCVDAAEGLQVPLDFTAIPAMVALAGAIGRIIGMMMKRNSHWVEPPVLWGADIGRPSSGKTPSLSPGRRMLDRLERQEREAFEARMLEYQASALVAGANLQNTKKELQNLLRDNKQEKAKELASAAQVKNEEPKEPRLVTNDATIEKVGELLNQNPRGIVMLRDELAGFLASMDREGHESDRAFWVECWNGAGSYTIDRIGRGTIRVEACAVSVLGGMQPGKLAEYVRGAVRGGFSDDGLIQRFQLAVYPDVPADWRYTDRAPDPYAEEQAWSAFKRLRELNPDSIGAEKADWADVPFLRFGDEAQELFIEWLTAHMQRLRAGNESPWMESHLAKYPGLVGRLALVLHLADRFHGNVTADTLAKALDWCDYLEGHARRIYSPATNSGLTGAHLILKRRADLGKRFSARDVHRKGWGGLADPEAAEAALDVLVEYGHLINVPVPSTAQGGRPTIAYEWKTTP